MHIPKILRTKLDDKPMKYVFMGYMVGDFGYHLWDPIKHKIVRSGDVIFNKLAMYERHTSDIEVNKIVDMFIKQ